MYKLVAFDLDGTVYDDNKEFPPGFFDELRRLTNKGILCVPASGRFGIEVEQTFAELGDSLGIVACNGHQVYLHNKLIYQATFDVPLLLELVERLLAVPDTMLNFSSTTTNYIMAKGPLTEWILETYLKTWTVIPVATDAPTWPANEEIVKITLFGKDGFDLGAMQEIMSFSPRIRPVFTSPYTCDVALDGANKATGLARLAAACGLEMADVMAFGDHMNDLEMIEAAGCGVAMGNAIPELKAVANRIAPTNQQYGVMSVLKEL